jgi:cobalt-zinc-cadmium efflux system membrane fusion protein
VSGVVERVAVDLGQSVKRGQVLAVISSAAISDLRSEQLAATRRLELARANHQREKALWEAKVTAEQDYLQAQQTLREAEIALANTQHKLSALGASAAHADGMARFELRAPFDGTIVEKHLAVGEAVREDAQVFTLSDLRQVWAEVNVPAQDLPALKVGAPCT